MPPIDPLIPLSLLRAVRGADKLPEGVGADAFGDELTTQKFGQSATVAAQIVRYESLVARGERVATDDVAALLRLVSRRSDAALVFADAGRRAGRDAATRISTVSRLTHRLAPGGLGERYGLILARRIAHRVFEINMSGRDEAEWEDQAGMGKAVAELRACEVYGAAAAELLRCYTEFDGALFHVACRTKGDAICQWHTNPDREV